ncbi:MAG TPA: carbohydrate ABC transporter permease [Anaerolineales bacterium]|nr:carbohydrate ABC transporter permease [Anaerolineales bacterium]HRF47359.1 carbohydrate ABC transporter permease [Anaerolineales bacterium]
MSAIPATQPPRRAPARNWARHANSAVVFLTLTALALVMIGIPIGWMALTAFKERQQIFAWPPVYWPDPIRWQNFSDVMTQMPFLRFGLNSLFIAVMNIVGHLFSCTLVAFAFARLRFPGRNTLFMLLIATLMIPGQIMLLPRFVVFQSLGWVGSYLPLIVPSFFGNAFFIFLMRQYIMTIPRDLDEAARIDGASTWDVFFRIILPLCVPPMVVTGVLTFLWTWNEFLDPLIYISKYDDYTIQLGLNMLKGRYNIQWNLIMAGSLIGVIPPAVLYFFAQKYLIGGIASVGIKG